MNSGTIRTLPLSQILNLRHQIKNADNHFKIESNNSIVYYLIFNFKDLGGGRVIISNKNNQISKFQN
jgi:hypothetical protein